MTKWRQAKTNDIGLANTKKKNKNILVQDENITDRWRENFDKLFNGEQGDVIGDTTIALLEENRN